MSAVTKNVCLEAHVSVEKYLTYPLQEVFKNVVHHVHPDCKADFGFHNRLILVAQSIVSFIALPFKMVFAIFSGIDTMCHPTDEKSWVNLTFAFATVALHALLVPAGIVLAFVPQTGFEEIMKIVQTFDKKGDTFEVAFKPVMDFFDEYIKHVEDTMPKPKAASREENDQEDRPASVDRKERPASEPDVEPRQPPTEFSKKHRHVKSAAELGISG
jgi:hypothetical protein